MQVYESLSAFIAYKMNIHFSKGLINVFVSQRMFIFLTFFHMLLKSNVVLFSRYLLIPTIYQTLFKDEDTKMRKQGLVEPAVLQEPPLQNTSFPYKWQVP